MTLKTWLFSKY